jgi:hypothetical protein
MTPSHSPKRRDSQGLKELVEAPFLQPSKPRGIVIVTDRGAQVSSSVTKETKLDLPRVIRGADGDEYVLISKKALEVEWLADEVESRLHARSLPNPGIFSRSRSSPQLPKWEEEDDQFVKLDSVLSRSHVLVKVADGILSSPAQRPKAQSEEALAVYLRALGMYQRASDVARGHFDTRGDVHRLHSRVKSCRDGFNYCLEQAERCRLVCESMGGAREASVEKIIYERVLDLARDAALKELATSAGNSYGSSQGRSSPSNGGTRDCEGMYSFGIKMLESLLDEDEDSEQEEGWVGKMEGVKGGNLLEADRRVLEECMYLHVD